MVSTCVSTHTPLPHHHTRTITTNVLSLFVRLFHLIQSASIETMKLSFAVSLMATTATAFSPIVSPYTRYSTSLNAVTTAQIKELREMTGAGMMDCKKVLAEFDGDVEAAADELRKKGLAKADKKASRIAAEGKIAMAKVGGRSVLLEVNCETDFVAKDESFGKFADSAALAAASLDSDDMDALMAADVGGSSVEEVRAGLVAKIGENIQVRRIASRGTDSTTTGAYIHMNRIGVLVELEGGSPALCTDVAMHVAAMNPRYATRNDVPAADIEKEREILTAQVAESGKPEDIIKKMVDGRLNKFLAENCLVDQQYVKTNDRTVQKLLEENGAKMVGFTRIAVGEGIEKKKDDFAAEVAAMAAGKV